MERDVMKKIGKHPNIVELLEFQETSSFYLFIMEYAGQETLKEASAWLRNNPPHLLEVLKALLASFRHLHNVEVFHGDIKLENIVCSRKKEIKVIDFGLSQIVQNPNETVRVNGGTPMYLAPEIITEHKTTGFQADVWALGVLFIKLLTGEFPFLGNLGLNQVKIWLQSTNQWSPTTQSFSQAVHSLSSRL